MIQRWKSFRIEEWDCWSQSLLATETDSKWLRERHRLACACRNPRRRWRRQSQLIPSVLTWRAPRVVTCWHQHESNKSKRILHKRPYNAITRADQRSKSLVCRSGHCASDTYPAGPATNPGHLLPFFLFGGSNQ